MKRAVINISGRVQCVGYRFFVKNVADELDLEGNIKNMKNSTVKITCEGEENIIEEFIKKITNPNKQIVVKKVQVKYFKPTGEYTDFEVVQGTLKDELFSGLITSSMYMEKMLDKQDQMVDKQDQMLELQIKMVELQIKMVDKQDQMVDKQDQMVDKQDKTIDEIHSLSSNIHDMMNSRFQRLENDMTVVKTKISKIVS